MESSESGCVLGEVVDKGREGMDRRSQSWEQTLRLYYEHFGWSVVVAVVASLTVLCRRTRRTMEDDREEDGDFINL